MPAVRAVVRDAAESDYSFAAIVKGVATSTPFRMRQLPDAARRRDGRGRRAAVAPVAA